MSRTTPLLIAVSSADPRPLGRQIVDAVRRLIATGELPVGAQLPSVRGLAQQLIINHNTVAKAYSDLVNEGWLDSRQGLGLFVAAPRQRLSDEECRKRLERAIQGFTAEVVGLGYPIEHVVQAVETALQPLLLRTARRRA